MKLSYLSNKSYNKAKHNLPQSNAGCTSLSLGLCWQRVRGLKTSLFAM